MAAHELTSCPRCRESFECKPGNITECQCFGLRFTPAEKEYIGRVSSDCLCRSCLEALKLEAKYQDTKEKLDQMRAIMSGK